MKIDFVIAQRKTSYLVHDRTDKICTSYQYTFIKALPRLYQSGHGTLIDTEHEGTGFFLSGFNIVAGETYDE